MKIDSDVRDLFRAQEKIANRLKGTVDIILRGAKKDSWHYESRVKKEQSFALKLETGRVTDPSEMEDVFAAVLVVPNAGDIPDAENLLREKFEFCYKKPETSEITSKASASFTFDDLRLYMRYKAEDYERPSSIDGRLFEVQIRTFLQHAWSVATHDVTYKTDSLNWRRERIAHQIKALLEQAEVAVENMTVLQESKVLPQSTDRYNEINRIIKILRQNWPDEQLPEDIKRLAETIQDMLWNTLRRPTDVELQELLLEGKKRNGGAHNIDWSPYKSVLQYLADQKPRALKALLRKPNGRKKILVYRDVLDGMGIEEADAKQGVVFPVSASD